MLPKNFRSLGEAQVVWMFQGQDSLFFTKDSQWAQYFHKPLSLCGVWSYVCKLMREFCELVYTCENFTAWLISSLLYLCLFLKCFYFYCVCIAILPVCMPVCCVCTWCLWRSEEGSGFPWTGVTDMSFLVGVRNQNSRFSGRTASALNSWAISPASVSSV